MRVRACGAFLRLYLRCAPAGDVGGGGLGYVPDIHQGDAGQQLPVQSQLRGHGHETDSVQGRVSVVFPCKIMHVLGEI